MSIVDSDAREVGNIVDLLGATENSFCFLHGFGSVGAEVGSGFPKAHRYLSGLLTRKGVLRDEKFYLETTLFGVYREPGSVSYMVQPYADAARGEWSVVADGEMFLYGAYVWDTNYQHFIIESLPRIWLLDGIAEFRHLPMVVSDETHVREIVGLCFPHREFIFLQEGAAVDARDGCIAMAPVSRNFSEIPDALAFAARHLRECVLRHRDTVEAAGGGASFAYFGRKYDPSYVGRDRVAFELEELLALLGENGFVVRDFDGKDLFRKAGELKGVSVAVTPVGANVMNLLLSSGLEKIVIIEHPMWHGGRYFARLLHRVGVIAREEDVLQFFGTYLDPEGKPSPVAPYHVRIDDLKTVISTVLGGLVEGPVV